VRPDEDELEELDEDELDEDELEEDELEDPDEDELEDSLSSASLWLSLMLQAERLVATEHPRTPRLVAPGRPRCTAVKPKSCVNPWRAKRVVAATASASTKPNPTYLRHILSISVFLYWIYSNIISGEILPYNSNHIPI